MKSSPTIWLASVISSGKFSTANASHVFLLLSPSFPLLSSLCICTFSICLSEFWNIPFYFLSAISVLEISMCPSLCLLILYLALPTLLASPWMMLLFFVRVFWSLEHLFGFLLVFPYLCWHFSCLFFNFSSYNVAHNNCKFSVQWLQIFCYVFIKFPGLFLPPNVYVFLAFWYACDTLSKSGTVYWVTGTEVSQSLGFVFI